MQLSHGASHTPEPKKATPVLMKISLGVVLAIAIFMAGTAVGNGTVTFGSTETQSKDLPNDLDYSSVEKIYDSLKEKYDGKLTEGQLLDGMKKGLAEATGDQWTEYMTSKEAKEFDSELKGNFTGIGAYLSEDDAGNVTVMSPISGSPADKAGIRAKDIIVSIDGKSTSGMTVSEASSKIRGEKDTKVTLKLVRNKTENIELTITRADIHIPSVEWKIEDNIGYMKVIQFNDEDTTELSTKAAQEFKDKKVTGVILDLRSNPGGTVPSAVNLSSLWLPSSKAVFKEKRGGVITNVNYSNGNDILAGIPTVILLDGGSASASEITAGAIHDNKAATIIGEKSYGKGKVQQVQTLSDGSILKVTISQWTRPNNENIDKKGITPDKVVTMSEDDYKNGRDPQKDAATTFLQAK